MDGEREAQVVSLEQAIAYALLEPPENRDAQWCPIYLTPPPPVQPTLPLDRPAAYAVAQRAMVENAQARDAQEGMRAFLEKRTPQWEN